MGFIIIKSCNEKIERTHCQVFIAWSSNDWLVGWLCCYFFPEFSEYNTQTTMPFMKNLNFDFSILSIYPVVIFIITATSNAVNLTDGLDGLAIG